MANDTAAVHMFTIDNNIVSAIIGNILDNSCMSKYN